MQHSITRDLELPMREPDTRIAPTGAYLSNYGYPAYRAYRAAPTGRQSDASITAGAS
jgi:hypothetical protein